VFKPHNFRKAWERATRIAGIEDFKFHDLRHSCASYLVRAGVPLNVIAEILGHTQIGTTQRYAHIAREHLYESMGHMSDLLG
jgi:site-specific recombinase XerD